MASTQVARPLTAGQLDQLCVNTIRTLAMDAVQQANSGHPGTPMGMAPVAYCLWQHFLRFDPNHPIWANRDRFVLSAGHASTLLYSMLHLTGVKAVNPKYETLGNLSVTLDDIKQFANWTASVQATPNIAGPRVWKPPLAPWDKGWRPVLGWPSPRGGSRATSIDRVSNCSITTSTRCAGM